MRHANLAGRAGRWSAAHWKTATVAWLAFAVLAVVVGMAVGTKELTDAESASGETAKAEQILQNAGFNVPATESVLVQSKTLTYKDEAFNVGVAGVVQTLATLSDVTNVVSPIEHPNAGQVSDDGHSVLVQFDIKGKADKAEDKIAPVLKAIDGVQAGNPSLKIEEFGQASANYALSQAFKSDLQRAEYTSLPLTLVILFVAFGALVAAGIPVLLAFSAVLAATGLNSLLSHIVHSSDATTSVILMVGMAVGIDYSLFYIQRAREERRAGKSAHDALLRTSSTSGQAVLISGATVLIAMAGMLFAGNAVFTTIGIGTMIVVAAAMIGSLSVLPALMHRLGDKIERGRIPFIGKRSAEPRFWSAVVDRVLARPVVSVVLSAGVLVALTVPAFSMHTKLPSFVDLPNDLKIVQTFKDVQAAFPGSQTPAVVVVEGPDVSTAAYTKAYDEFRTEAVATGLLFRPFHVHINPDKSVARVEFSIAGNGDNAASMRALDVLRNKVIPNVSKTIPDATVAVTGVTAGTRDFNDRMKARLPVVFAFVLGLAFILMLLSFRSIVIPIKTVLLNLLSVGAAYGILVLVFNTRGRKACSASSPTNRSRRGSRCSSS